MKIKLSTVAFAALLFIGLTPASSSAYIGISVGFAPPAIPIYTQPYCPGPGYLWVPGYWAWNGFDYYWVPGYWAYPPRIGFYWTPGYWGYSGSRYVFYDGYWGPRVGYYGGINYGFGYFGSGYYGGEWVGSTFRYNTAVTRVDTTVIKNTYVNNNYVKTTTTRASFNGPGGVTATATAEEKAVPKSERIAATSEQRSRVEAAKKDPALRAKNNQGKPKEDAVQAFNRSHGVKAGGGKVKGETETASTEAGVAKAKGATAQENAANTASDRKQGGGKVKSDEARASHETAKTKSTKPTRLERPEATSTHARNTTFTKPTSRSYNAPTTRRGPQRSETFSRGPMRTTGRQAGPTTTTRGKAATEPSQKKKKKSANEPSGHGR